MKQFWAGIADILEKNKAISSDTAKMIKQEFTRNTEVEIDEFLLSEGLVDKENLLRALSRYFKVPAFDVEGYFFSHMLLRQFPEDFLMRNNIIPLEIVEDEILIMIASNPFDENLLPRIGEYVSYDIQFYVGLAQAIRDTIEEYYDDSLTEPIDDETMLREQEEEKKALEIAKRIIDSDQNE